MVVALRAVVVAGTAGAPGVAAAPIPTAAPVAEAVPVPAAEATVAVVEVRGAVLALGWPALKLRAMALTGPGP